MTRQIQSPTRLLAVLAGIVGLMYLFCVGFTSNSTASASTPAPGSSCAHPWKVYYVVRDRVFDPAPGFGNSTHYLSLSTHLTIAFPDDTFAVTAKPKLPGVRLCRFVGQLTGTPPAALKCTHPGFSLRGWSVASSRSTTCTITANSDWNFKVLYATAARG